MQPDRRWGSTGHTAEVRNAEMDRTPEYDPRTGDHLWIWAVSFRARPELLGDPTPHAAAGPGEPALHLRARLLLLRAALHEAAGLASLPGEAVMAKPREATGDPAARAARKRRRRAAGHQAARHNQPTQFDHASNPKARRRAREGEQAMERDREEAMQGGGGRGAHTNL